MQPGKVDNAKLVQRALQATERLGSNIAAVDGNSAIVPSQAAT